ncbi:AAA family ATPase [Nisaea sp.]|uniref:AAA family ATPase n=1 Tax=Nisaea sp. TaxID=2024842 RepID=UPI003B51A4C9
MSVRNVLIILGGLPGTGKTTIARALAEHLPAQHLRIDSIEGALRRERPELDDLRDTGYQIAYTVAEDNLRLGQSVIADSVNPISLTRAAWRAVAGRAERAYVEIEIVCSSTEIHKVRIEERWHAHDGIGVPDWDKVRRRHYELWLNVALQVDTAHETPEQSAERILNAVRAVQPTS